MVAIVEIPSDFWSFIVTDVRKQKSANLLMDSLLTDFLCDPGGARTLDPLIKSQLLYQLSHGVKKGKPLLISDCKGTTNF